MSEQRNYMAEVQSLIDLKWKENPEEMKRVMAEIKAKEKKEKKAKVKNQKRVSFDPKLTQELIEELNKSWDDVDITKVQDLIKRGADVDAKRNDGGTPLHWASERNYIEIAKLLIKAGADLEAKTDWGWTPLHWANSVAIADLLIEAGADVNAKKVDGWTPLHLASGNNHIEIAKFLLERGADVNAKDNGGRTPLDWAGSDEMKTLLQKYMK
jgi:ankyrin repeat protein